jgi:hypothetical protein
MDRPGYGSFGAPLAHTWPVDPSYPRLKGRRLRLVVFVAWFATVWFVALPALASGPMCDDRGASWIAPSPVLIVVPDTLDVDPAAPSCEKVSADTPAYQRDRVPAEPDVTPDTQALPATHATIAFLFVADGLLDPIVLVDAAPPGVRYRVERPPRG